MQQSKTIDLSNADIWDDTLLIKAYDESLKLAKEEVAKRIARSTNKQKSNDVDGDDGEDGSVSKQSQGQYKIGDYVRATYEDGLDYEAKIISIDAEKENCVVRFIGYDNEETVDLNNLLSSWGKNVRKKQMRTAANDLAGGTENKRNAPMSFPNCSVPDSVPIPLLPPIPPMLNDTTEDSENMSAMLMSWYMSGYYTGYYQGQKDAQNKTSKM